MIGGKGAQPPEQPAAPQDPPGAAGTPETAPERPVARSLIERVRALLARRKA